MSRVAPIIVKRNDVSDLTLHGYVSSFMNDSSIDEYNSHLRKRCEVIVPPARCIVDISNPWRIRWNLFMIALAFYSCVCIPYMLAFTLPANNSIYVILTDFLIDCLFIFDIVLVLRTSYIKILTGVHVND